jgi:hypothetical protein
MSPFRTRRGLLSATVLSAAASALALAACGGSGDESAGAVSRQSNSQSNNQSATGSNTQSSTQNGSQTSTSSSGSMSQSSFSTDEGLVRTFAGSGSARITVDVEKDSRLLWSNDKGRQFRLSGTGGSDVDSTAGSGEIQLPSGRHRLVVEGAVFTVVIRPN